MGAILCTIKFGVYNTSIRVYTPSSCFPYVENSHTAICNCRAMKSISLPEISKYMQPCLYVSFIFIATLGENLHEVSTTSNE